MKKLNVLMAGMAVAALLSCNGGAGTGKVTMNDVKDTISYSIGMGRAVRVYKDQLPYDIVDSVTMKSFIKGFMEAAKDPENKEGLAYALGYEIGSQEMSQAFVGLSSQLFGEDGGTFNKSNYISGFRDGLMENWKYMSFEEADETSNRLYEVLTQQQYDKVRNENAAYLEEKAKEDDVFKTESGLLYQVVKLGDGGPKPTETSDVEVRYHGELIDGTVFDESKEPITLNLSRVIPGWTEGLQLMSVGDKYKFFIPYDLAYGERGQGSIKPFATLIFDVELVNIK
ncbi:MAG: FKBP-type peptidyl-prolyl cis-trans isomerase [Bacteroidaceae bacterium]|nr:FKBP-type peptidyl-prolyl cis-trans isomerase [Bacteroidaceae bacterium]